MNVSTTHSILVESETASFIFKVVWLSGITVSSFCFLLQLTFFVLKRNSRKTDEKILAHITFTRIMLTVCEYYVVYIRHKTRPWLDFIFTVYFVTDFALVCWMLVFTKNLYDKIVIVFSTKKLNLIFTTIYVWTVSLPFGLIGVCVLKYGIQYFQLYCSLIYALLKFLILLLNILIYFRIFYVAFKRGGESTRNLKDVLKSAFVASFLIITTCLQILVTDLISYISGAARNILLVKIFCVINSYHTVPITAIFIIILKSRIRDSLVKTVTLRLTELVT